jgi:hypothetical protein|tara:strand:- start:3001 stop:3360 length:360 start_codon:yes stop_codon:yes gene_type:complete
MSKVFSLHNLPAVEDCVDYAHYCESRRSVGLQVMPASLFNAMKHSIIFTFDKAFKAAIICKANINADGSINWNFVESDIWLTLAKVWSDDEISAVMHDEFGSAAEEEIEYKESMKGVAA